MYNPFGLLLATNSLASIEGSFERMVGEGHDALIVEECRAIFNHFKHAASDDLVVELCEMYDNVPSLQDFKTSRNVQFVRVAVTCPCCRKTHNKFKRLYSGHNVGVIESLHCGLCNHIYTRPADCSPPPPIDLAWVGLDKQPPVMTGLVEIQVKSFLADWLHMAQTHTLQPGLRFDAGLCLGLREYLQYRGQSSDINTASLHLEFMLRKIPGADPLHPFNDSLDAFVAERDRTKNQKRVQWVKDVTQFQDNQVKVIHDFS